MRYLCTGVSEPGQGLPPFIVVGYVDDQPIVKYDSETEKSVHQVSWMLKAEKDNAQYWEKSNEEFIKLDIKFSQYLLDLQDQYNQSKGFHTLQLMYGCELSPDGGQQGYYRYGYDGRDFLSFEKETLIWKAADREAQVMKRKWHAELAKIQYRKAYLEEECIEWLQRYLDYGNGTLLRTELPVGKVTRQVLPDSQESLICQAYGFYPREVNTTWRKDGEVMEHATFRRDVAPNSNGTYHAWLSIDVDPQDRNRYYCHIEHVSLTKPLVLAWEEPGGSTSHSLRYFYTAVSEPGQGLPQFITVGYVDDQQIDQYDSDTKEALPRVPWIRKVEKEDPQYWHRNTQIYQGNEPVFRVSLQNLRNRYNQSEGIHTLQNMYGCELRSDGRKGGYRQYGYDGRDFIAFDKDTLTWTAAQTEAQVSKRKLDPIVAQNQYLKAYLEEECIEWLQRYLEYGKETLLRTEAPEVKVTRKAGYDNLETLVCQVHGFYPKEIDANWVKDGEVWQEGTSRGLVAPNSDGTYYVLLSVKIDPEERDRFRCRVDHDSLEKPLDVAWEKEPGKRSEKSAYKAASTSDKGSDSSASVSYQPGV
ncbi:uncharacterized protein LOC117042848 [Lacerta agilis]|uniref:uncharacterized protein LOC117042848 n=1 Tax=Lacerta agilis TaxID=80427 RepID=UPI001419FFE8|nr:uncharacterized protein LOC117042848 [Lacerta agilis]